MVMWVLLKYIHEEWRMLIGFYIRKQVKQAIHPTTMICWSLCLYYWPTLIFRKSGDDKRSNTSLTGVSLGRL